MKNRSLWGLVLLFLSLFLLSSCADVLYQSHTVNAPLMYGKGDYRINGGMGVSVGPSTPTFDLQGAYAFSKHFALMANASWKNGEEQDYAEASHHKIYEVGAGYFRSSEPQGRMRFDFFSGYGTGSSRIGEKEQPEDTAEFYKVFMQPSIGYRDRDIDFSVGSRLEIVNFTDRVLGFTTLEFFTQIGIGYKNVRGFFQLSGGLPVSGTLSYERANDIPAILMFNLGVTISPWKEREVYPEKDTKPNIELAERNVTQVNISSSEVKFCLQSPDKYPDVDLVKITFNGELITKKVRPEEKPDCFDLNLKDGIENSLLIQLVSDGMKEGCTIQLSFSDGDKEEIFYLNPSFDYIDEIKFYTAN